MSNISVKEESGFAVISGFQSQVEALQLCDHLQNFGVKTAVVAGAEAYQVTVYTLSVQDVVSLLELFHLKVAKQ